MTDYIPKTRLGQTLLIASFVGGCLIAIVGGYKAVRSLELVPFAYSSDIETVRHDAQQTVNELRLEFTQYKNYNDRKQTDTDIQLWQNSYRSWLALPEPNSAAGKRAREIEVQRALQNLHDAERRKAGMNK